MAAKLANAPVKAKGEFRSRGFIHTPLLDDLRVFDRELQSIAKKYDVPFLSAIKELCDDENCKAVLAFDGAYVPAAWDYGHLTDAASTFLAKKILRQINEDTNDLD